MATPNQIRANRANALRSTGPKTAAGKQASSRNSIRHGMLAQAVVLDGESDERFKDLLAGFTNQLNPRTDAESALVETMAIARWKQMRIWGVQKAGFNLEMAQLNTNCNVPATRAYMAFKNLADNSNVLPLLHRYETGYDRQFCRAYAFYLKLRDKPESPLEDTDFSQMSFAFATETWEPAPEPEPDEPTSDPVPAAQISEEVKPGAAEPQQEALAPTAAPAETSQTTQVPTPKPVLRHEPNFPQPPVPQRLQSHPAPRSQSRGKANPQ